jgi:hypothetical protein
MIIRRPRAHTRVAALGIIALAGCGGAAVTRHAAAPDFWIDPTYHASPTIVPAVALAPAPFTGMLAERVDQGLERAIMDTPGSQLRVQPSMVRQRMNANREFVLVMDRIVKLKYTPKDFPSANLQSVLSLKELTDLRTALGAATMLLLPIEFTVQSTPKSASGQALYRAYSLDTGRLLAQKHFDRRSSTGGDAGEREVTVGLILDIQDDFAKHFSAQ